MAKTTAGKAEEERLTKANSIESDVEEKVEPEFDMKAYLNERVMFMAIKDNERYKDDISLSINGKRWLIQRGKPVMIPRFVYQAIMDTERQKGVASTTSQGLQDRFKQITSNMN